jgi:hypothetical protein
MAATMRRLRFAVLARSRRARASRRTIASPIPLVDPVTSAIWVLQFQIHGQDSLLRRRRNTY